MDFRDAVLEFTVALPTLRRCEDNSANTYSEITARVKMVKDDSPSYLWHIFFVAAAKCCVRNGTSNTAALRRKFRGCALRNPIPRVKMMNDESPSYTALHIIFLLLGIIAGAGWCLCSVFARNFQQHSPRNASFAAGCMDHPTGFRLAAERCQNFRLSAAFLHMKYACLWHGLQ